MSANRNKIRATRYTIHGFTLIEVLVSLSIFSVLAIISMNLYSSAVNLDRQGNAHRAVQQNGTFLFEFLAKEIRNGALDYQSYTGQGVDLTVMPISNLKLLYRGTADRHEEIYLDQTSGQVLIKRERAGQAGVYDTSAITNPDVKVNALSFFVSPSNECTESSVSCTQQRVTVVLTIESNTPEVGAAKGITADFQTTFSARVYSI